MYKVMISVCCLVLSCLHLQGQTLEPNPMRLNQVLGIGFGFNMATASNSSVNVSLNYAAYLKFNSDFGWSALPAYQGSVNIYYKGIGSNYAENKFNLDFHNSFGVTVAYVKEGGQRWSQNGFYFINQSYVKNSNIIPLESRASLTLATNLILNSQQRNQTYGAITIQPLPFVRVQYYNDGGPILSQLNIADKWDRWWTGGGFVEFGNDFNGVDRQAFPKFSVAYHRFTWENEKSFKISSLFGLPFIPISKEKIKQVFFNSGQYVFGVSWRNEDYMLTFNNILPDFQDIIHLRLGSSRHNTFGNRYWGAGVFKTIRY